jgi:ubiquitin-protein ligase
MASKVAQKRLQKEYLAMQKAPPPFIWAVPEEKNILDCECSHHPLSTDPRLPSTY